MSFFHHKGQFKNKADARSRAKRTHLCLSCLHNQPKTFKDCPQCGSQNRVFMPSRAEHLRAVALIQKQVRGEISQLKFHPAFDLVIEGTKVCKYVADVQYVENGKQIVEDTKATGSDFIEPLAELKIAVFNALFAKFGLQVKIHRNAQ